MLTSESGQYGGMEIRMSDEARLLTRMGYDVLVAPRSFPEMDRLHESLTGFGEQSLVRPYDVPLFLDEWRYHRINQMKAHLRVYDLMTAWKPDLIHIFFPWTNQGLSRLWLAATRGVPTVISVHNCFPKTQFAPRIGKRLYEAFRTLRGVYGVSSKALEGFWVNFQEFVPGDVVSDVIYNHVNTERFQPNSDIRGRVRGELGLNEETLLIGSVGRISEQKRPLDLTEAFADVAEERPEACLLLIGDGDLRQDVLDKARDLGIADRVIVTGWVDPSRFLPALDLHVLASEREGFGIASIEALACGIPSIAVKSPGSVDILADCEAACLVDSDARAIGLAMRDLLEDPMRRMEMGRQARAFVKGRYDDEKWQMAIASFYCKVIRRQ